MMMVIVDVDRSIREHHTELVIDGTLLSIIEEGIQNYCQSGLEEDLVYAQESGHFEPALCDYRPYHPREKELLKKFWVDNQKVLEEVYDIYPTEVRDTIYRIAFEYTESLIMESLDIE